MNIYLCGFMGAGKTTVGKLLAEKLNCAFYDTDELITAAENIQITEIFAQKGEEYFRTLETETLKKISSLKNAVVSTGGGIVMRDENINIMRASGILIYLKAAANTIFSRVNPETRPLLKGLTKVEMLEKIKYLLALREKSYYLCNHIIEVDELSPSEICQTINDISLNPLYHKNK